MPSDPAIEGYLQRLAGGAIIVKIWRVKNA
jgi:hypothetical protein